MDDYNTICITGYYCIVLSSIVASVHEHISFAVHLFATPYCFFFWSLVLIDEAYRHYRYTERKNTYKEMMRNNSRSTVSGAIQEELRSQPKGNNGVPISSTKLRAPVVRRQSLDGNQSEVASIVGYNRISNSIQAKITSRRGNNDGAKPISKGSSSFMGSSRNPAPIKKENPKPIVYINKPNVPLRIPSNTTTKDHIGNAARTLNAPNIEIGTVSKVLGNSNRKDHDGVITKTSKAAIVDDYSRGSGGRLDSVRTVTKILSTSNRPSNATKTNQPSSIANKGNTCTSNNNPQRPINDSGNVAHELQYIEALPNNNRKENNVVHKQARSTPGKI